MQPLGLWQLEIIDPLVLVLALALIGFQGVATGLPVTAAECIRHGPWCPDIGVINGRSRRTFHLITSVCDLCSTANRLRCARHSQ